MNIFLLLNHAIVIRDKGKKISKPIERVEANTLYASTLSIGFK